MCRCQAAPTLATAIPDSLGRLWGWMSGINTSCAYKDSNGGALTFVSLTASPVSADASSQTNTTAPATSTSTPSTGTMGAPKRTPSIRILAEGAETLITTAATRTLNQLEDAPAPGTSLGKIPTDNDLQLLLSLYPSNAPSGPITPGDASLAAYQPQVQILDAASLQRAASTAAEQQAALGLDPQTAAEGARTSAIAAFNASILATTTAAAAAVEDGPPVNVSMAADGLAVTSPGSPHVTLPGGGPHPTSVTINGKPAIAAKGTTGTRRSLASRAAEALKALVFAATRTDAVTAPQPPLWGHRHARRELPLQQQRQRPTTLVLPKAGGATVAAAPADERQLRSGPQLSEHSHHHNQHKSHRSKVHRAHGHYTAEPAVDLPHPVPARSTAEVPAAVMQRYPEHLVAEAALAAAAGNLGQGPHGSVAHPVHPIDSFYRRTMLAASPAVEHHESGSWDAQISRRQLLGDSDFPSCKTYPAPASVVQDGAGRCVRRVRWVLRGYLFATPEVEGMGTARFPSARIYLVS